MNEGKIVVGIDIGTSKIVTLIARVDESINILGVSEVKASGVRKGQIVDIEDAVLAITTSLESAERMAGYQVSHVVASISGSHVESQNSRGVVAVSNPEGEIGENDIDRVIEAARAISLSSQKEIIHVLPRNYTVDGQEGIKDPTGMTGVRLEVDTHIITANTAALKILERALSGVGVDLDGIVFNGYASSLSALTETERELGVVLVDIGSGTTDVCVYVDGSVAYSSVLPVGARHITNDLAIGLRVSLESAEKIKLFLSQASPPRIVRPDEDEFETRPKDATKSDEIDVVPLNLPEELRKVSRKTLVDGIIRPRLNEIFTMIGVEIKKSGFVGQTPAGIVITGGGARTVGAVDAAKRMLAMPVRIAYPTNLKGIIDEVQDTPFSTVVGLVSYASKIDVPSSMPFGISLPAFNFLPRLKIFKKLTDIIKSFIP